MIHIAALEQVMHTLTQEARASLSSATPLNEAVKRLEEAVRVHPFAVMFSDNTGRYVGANASAAELTGYSRRELLTASIFDITPPIDEREVEILWRAFCGRAVRMERSPSAGGTDRRWSAAISRQPMSYPASTYPCSPKSREASFRSRSRS